MISASAAFIALRPTAEHDHYVRHQVRISVGLLVNEIANAWLSLCVQQSSHNLYGPGAQENGARLVAFG